MKRSEESTLLYDALNICVLMMKDSIVRYCALVIASVFFSGCGSCLPDIDTVCGEGYQDNDNDNECLISCDVMSCEMGLVCNDSSGTATCVTDVDMSSGMIALDMPDSMAGEDMVADMSVDMKATCPEGRQDNDGDGACSPACDVLTCGASANTCDDSSGLIECICALGYMGPRCGTCAEGYKREAAVCVPDDAPVCDLNCNQGQECQIINGIPQCVGGQPMCSPACGTGQVCQLNANNMPQCIDTCGPGTQDLNGDGECIPTCAVWEDMGGDCGRAVSECVV